MNKPLGSWPMGLMARQGYTYYLIILPNPSKSRKQRSVDSQLCKHMLVFSCTVLEAYSVMDVILGAEGLAFGKHRQDLSNQNDIFHLPISFFLPPESLSFSLWSQSSSEEAVFSQLL